MTIGCCQAGSVFAATDTHVNFHLLCPMTATIGVYDRTNGPSMFFSDSFCSTQKTLPVSQSPVLTQVLLLLLSNRKTHWLGNGYQLHSLVKSLCVASLATSSNTLGERELHWMRSLVFCPSWTANEGNYKDPELASSARLPYYLVLLLIFPYIFHLLPSSYSPFDSVATLFALPERLVSQVSTFPSYNEYGIL